MQEKEWTRAFGRCNSWSTRARKSQRGNDCAERKSRAWGPNHPRTAPVFCRQVALSFLSLCAKVCAQNHCRHSQPS
jgi:hypothetical protein